MRAFTSYEQNRLKKYHISQALAQKSGAMPVEYITGFAEFGGYDFAVNPNVLIPRVESIQIVEIAISRLIRTLPHEVRQEFSLKSEKESFAEHSKAKVSINHCSINPKRQYLIADVGCGSGNLGINLFLELQKRSIASRVYLSDLSEKALNIAQQNVKRLVPKKLTKNLIFLKSNLLKGYPKDLRLDVIAANLPYIPSSRLEKLPASVKNYEPLMALDGGLKGLQLIKALIRQVPNYLRENGAIILEIDDKHKISDFAEFTNFKKEVKKDCFGRNRFLTLTLKV